MPINASGAVGSPLLVFGSWVTDVSPDAVPEGVSPDNQEVVFFPGGVGSRPGFDAVEGINFPAVNGIVPTGVYGKSFVTPTGDVKNLYFDSAGRLWVEDFTNAPNIITLLFQSTPASFCQSITKFGREYIAISDGLHGQEMPLQYDGAYLDRWTNDGPANAPTVTSISLPAVSVAMVPSLSTSIVSATTTNEIGGLYYSLSLIVASTAGIQSGQYFSVSGNSNSVLNNEYIVSSVTGPTTLVLIYSNFGAPFETGTGGTLASASSSSLTRGNNIVTVNTSAAHNLKVGYQALLQGNGTLALGSGIASIAINNEDNPGIALVTTNAPHGLLPGNDVTITGVQPTMIGASGGWTADWNGSSVTLTLTSGAHGLVPGAVIQVKDSNSPADAFPGAFTVASVPAPNQLSYYQTGLAATAPISATGISVLVTWPIPDDTPNPTYFEVQEVPSPTTFQVQVTYADGSWSSGTVSFAWDGTFYVSSVPSPTSFTYLQYGPNGTTAETSGTVTPWGQAAPGLHLVALAYLNRQGGITSQSPFATWESSGGQYPSVTDLPAPPANIEAILVLFTGAQPNVPGELPPFFYIPTTPQLEGQIVGTATQIPAGTASAVLDFSDDTLYAATGVSISGNNIANQIVVDGALGFRTYLDRLLTFGQRNTVNNLLNMGFDADGPGTNNPQGWTLSGDLDSGVTVAISGRPGVQWRFNCASPQTLSQGAYQDCYGDPILLPNLVYKIRGWFNSSYIGSGGSSFTATLSSVSTSFSTSATIPNSAFSASGSYLEARFSAATPASIPADLIFIISVSATGPVYSITADELWLIPTETPYLENESYGSYVNNPEGIDGDSGQWGPDDTAKIMDMAIVRKTLCVVTQAPSGKLHETVGSAVTEPDGWEVNPVAGECGILSAFCLTTSQADDSSESGGEDWMAWASDVGAIIYGGGSPEKISQEIQPNWNDATRQNAAVQINMAAATSVWGLNDPVTRLLMFGLPVGSAAAPSQIYVLNYQHLGSAQAIAGSPPFHPSFAGKLIATDNSRKWTHFLSTMNGASRMYRSEGELTNCFFGGNGQALGTAPGYGHIYTLNPALTIDDDYGQFFPYYFTYAFLDPERRQQMQMKNGRLLLAFVLAQIQPVAGDTNSQVTLAYYPDSMENLWPLSTTRTLTANFYKDRNFGGGMAQGERIFIKIYPSPVEETGCSFVLTRLEAFFRNARILVSGVNQ
jgi:hypothetical protein